MSHLAMCFGAISSHENLLIKESALWRFTKNPFPLNPAGELFSS